MLGLTDNDVVAPEVIGRTTPQPRPAKDERWPTRSSPQASGSKAASSSSAVVMPLAEGNDAEGVEEGEGQGAASSRKEKKEKVEKVDITEEQRQKAQELLEMAMMEIEARHARERAAGTFPNGAPEGRREKKEKKEKKIKTAEERAQEREERHLRREKAEEAARAMTDEERAATQKRAQELLDQVLKEIEEKAVLDGGKDRKEKNMNKKEKKERREERAARREAELLLGSRRHQQQWTMNLPSRGTSFHSIDRCTPCVKFLQRFDCPMGAECPECHHRSHIKLIL